MDPTTSTQMLNDIMAIPIVAQVISISVTLGLMSGGIFVAWNFIKRPFLVIKIKLYTHYTRHLSKHSSQCDYIKYVRWLSDHNDLMYFNRNYKSLNVYEYDEETGESVMTPRLVAGYGTSFFYIKEFGLVKVSRHQVESNQTIHEVEVMNFVFYGNSEEKLKKFVIAIEDYYESTRKEAVPTVYKVGNDGGSRHIGEVKQVLEPLSADAHAVVNDVEEFINNERFYRNRGMPYKRGYMLYGPPGTGKTSLIAHLANKFKLDVYTTDGSYTRFHSEKTCILLIEDIDLTILGQKRENTLTSLVEETIPDSTKKEQDVSEVNPVDSPARLGDSVLRDFLNDVDGITETSGVIVIITSNKPDVLDPALLRPGRIDVKAYLGDYTTNEQLQHFNRFYETDYSYDGELKPISCARLQNICATKPHDSEAAWNELMEINRVLPSLTKVA